MSSCVGTIVWLLPQNGQAFGKAINSFATELHRSSQSDTWVDAQPQLASSLAQFGQTLAQLQECQDVLFITLDSTFIRPLETFVKKDVSRAYNASMAAEVSSAEYESALTKFLALKKNANPATRQSKVGRPPRRSCALACVAAHRLPPLLVVLLCVCVCVSGCSWMSV